jgi:hypothetical protein
MKIPLLYGLYSAIGGAIVTLLLYFTGFHDSVEKFTAAQWIGGVAGFLIMVTCLALAMRDKRALAPADAEWGYGSAFGAGVLTGLFIAVFNAIVTYIYFAFINPNMPDIIFAMQQAKMEAKGLSATQIANAEPLMRKMMSPGITACLQVIGGFIFTVIVSLIVAIFFRQPRPAAAVGEAPPPMA